VRHCQSVGLSVQMMKNGMSSIHICHVSAKKDYSSTPVRLSLFSPE
jgi:hypothetical protein